MNQHIFLEPTEAGIALGLTFEQEHNCKVVYKETEDGQGYAFAVFGIIVLKQNILMNILSFRSVRYMTAIFLIPPEISLLI